MAYKRIVRWYWLSTAIALGVEMAGWPEGAWAAISIAVINTIHCSGAAGRSFPLQVRVAYLAMLMAGLWPPLFFLHVIQFVGTWALVLANYCFLARCLSLLPWNRTVPVTADLVLRTFLSRPVLGSFVEARPG